MTRSSGAPALAAPGTSPAAGGSPTSVSPRPGPGRQAARRLVGVTLIAHMLRSRGFYERAAVAAIVVAAVAALNKEGRAKAFAGLAAWAKRQDQRLERKVKTALTSA